MTEKLTEEQARRVKLPRLWHFDKRLAKLNDYGEALGVHTIPGALFPAILTRGDLVYFARHEDKVEAFYAGVRAQNEARQAEITLTETIEGEE